MYNVFKNLFNKIYMTEVFTGRNTRGDAYFDYHFDRRKWKTLHEKDLTWPKR